MKKSNNKQETVYNIALDSTIQILRSGAVAESPKTQALGSWGIFNLFGCCSTDSSETMSSHKTRMNETNWTTSKALAHYHLSDTGSFIDIQKTSSTNQATPKASEKLSGVAFSEFKNDIEELFLLGSGADKIICRIEKILLRSSSDASEAVAICGIKSCLKRSECLKCAKRKNLLSQVKGNKFLVNLYENNAAELVAEQIGKSFQDLLIVDGYSGNGGDAIQFALQSNSVIAIERDYQKISSAKNAAKSYNVEQSIEFLQADFLSMSKLRGDVVFLAPAEIKMPDKTPFSIFCHVKPDLEKLIGHSMNIASHVCIKLPHQTQIEEIGKLFSQIFDANNLTLEASHSYAIRIQQICIDDRPECLIVHFGSHSQVTEKEANDYLGRLLIKYEPAESKVQYDQTLIKSLIQSLGARFILKTLLAQLQSNPEHLKNNSVLKILYENVKCENHLFSKLLSALKRDQNLASNFRLSGCALDFHSLAWQNASGNPLTTVNDSLPKEHFLNGDSLPIARSYCRSTSQKLSPNNQQIYRGSFREGDMELSEILVSSYSLKSGALLDSDTESLKTRRMMPSCEGSFMIVPQKIPRTLSSTSQIPSIKEEISTPSVKDRQRSDFKRGTVRRLDLRFESPDHKSPHNSPGGSPRENKQKYIAFSQVTRTLRLQKFSQESTEN